MRTRRNAHVTLAVAIPSAVAALLAVPSPASAATSESFAGWRKPLNYPAVATVTATIVVPGVECRRGGPETLFVAAGVSGVSVDTPSVAFGQVTASCAGRTPHYATTTVITGSRSPADLTVRPGDRVAVTASTDPNGGRARVALTVERTGQSLTSAGANFGGTGADLRVYARNTPAFDPVRFADASINAKAFGSTNPIRLDQVTGNGTVIAAPTSFGGDNRSTSVRDRR